MLLVNVWDRLWQGSHPDTSFRGNQEWVVVSLTENPYRVYLNDVPYAHVFLPIADAAFPGLPWLRQACSILDAFQPTGRKILIHCTAGISRSTMLVAGYLMHNLGLSRAEALGLVARVNPKLNPNPSFMAGLLEWEAREQ